MSGAATTGVRLGRPAAYAGAAMIAAASIGVRLIPGSPLQGYPYVTVFPAVVLATYLFGRLPGLLSVLLCGLGAWYFLVPPQFSFHLRTLSDATGLTIYFCVAVLDWWIVAKLVDTLAAERTERARADLLAAEQSRMAAQNELLLRELRHRVGNSLQTVVGLLELQTRRLAEPAARAAFVDASARVRLLLRAQRQMLEPDQVDFGRYLGELAGELAGAMRPDVAVSVTAFPLRIAPDQAVPLALIAYELISNALEHAFPPDRGGTVTVTLERAGEGAARLRVVDDGDGLPPPGKAGPPGLGTGIVRALAAQIDGRFELSGGPGTVAEVTFPLLEA
ncbi:MAG TPA: DUF4118 domain-containing protein [Azospirillaceae bacterium]|nr:DUF4118 domain-containing protein [Azospirillaceae bacterium]